MYIFVLRVCGIMNGDAIFLSSSSRWDEDDEYYYYMYVEKACEVIIICSRV